MKKRTLSSIRKEQEACIDLPDEKWAPVLGYESTHLASNIGRIKSLYRQKVRKNGRIQTSYTKILTCTPDSKGYFQVKLYDLEGKISIKFVHRLVYMAFNDYIPSTIQIDHMDSNIENNRLDNLQAIDPMEHSRISNERYLERAYNKGFQAGYEAAIKEHCEIS